MNTATLAPVLTIGARRFVPRGKLVDTLFMKGGTADGEYRRNKGGILLTDSTGAPRVFVVDNKYGERFFVSCGRGAAGRIRYLHSTTTPDESWLGLPASLADSHALAASIAESIP